MSHVLASGALAPSVVGVCHNQPERELSLYNGPGKCRECGGDLDVAMMRAHAVEGRAVRCLDCIAQSYPGLLEDCGESQESASSGDPSLRESVVASWLWFVRHFIKVKQTGGASGRAA